MRVLITGAGGFVGGYLISHLLEMEPGCEIIGAVHPLVHDAPSHSQVKFVPCDITASDGADIAQLLRESRPDRLYHLAGAASGASVDRDMVFRVNVEGTRNVIRAAQDIVAPEHILFASTGYVYGTCDLDRPAREDDPLPPSGQNSVYAESKRAAEELVRETRGAVVARSFNHTGPGQSTAFAVPAFAAQVVEVERARLGELLVGNLDAVRDFLDVRDVVRAYRLLVEHGVAGEVYNVCSGQPYRMCDILDKLRGLAHVVVSVKLDPDRMRQSDIAVSVGDHGRLTNVAGWQPTIPLTQTLLDTLEWWRAH